MVLGGGKQAKRLENITTLAAEIVGQGVSVAVLLPDRCYWENSTIKALSAAPNKPILLWNHLSTSGLPTADSYKSCTHLAAVWWESNRTGASGSDPWTAA